MTFGLAGESRKLLERIVRSRTPAGAPDAAMVNTMEGPAYLPLETNEAENPLAGLPEQWVNPQADFQRVPIRSESGGRDRSWNCVLHGGTIHYKEQMHLLCRARKMLKDGGKLLLAGEFLHDVETMLKSDLPTEFSLRQLADRLGFRLLETIDWTDKARLSVAEAQSLVVDPLPAAGFPPAAWLRSLRTGMRESNEARPDEGERKLARELDALAAEFESGHRRFECFVFALDPKAGGPWSELDLGGIDSFEPEEVAEIFEESFGEKFDPALWRWKYGEGKGTCIVARIEPGAPVIAHYGGVAREIDYFGEDRLAFQGCDVMVKPAVRRQYGRNSLYFHMTATLFEREIGYTVDHVLGFGFPNKPVMKTAVRLGLYGKVDDYVELAFGDFQESIPELQVEPLQLQDNRHAEPHGKSVDELWQAMRKDFGDGVIGKRHGEYLDYRYFRHPYAGAYFPLLLSRESEAFAVAVLKRHEQQWLLMDLVAPLARMEDAAGALATWTESRPESGALAMWLTRAWTERLNWGDRIVKNLGIEIPFNAWNPSPDQTLPKGAWWLTAGDMDFI